MPRILLDRHIDEAAMKRRDDSPNRYRRGAQPRAVRRVTVADVVHSAMAPAAFAAPAPRPVAERSHLTDRDTRVIRFDDLPPEDPNLLTADPRHAAPIEATALAPSPLRAGHEHADTVLPMLRAETPKLAAPDPNEHLTHHQKPNGFELCAVLLVDPVAALCDDVELHIARFACAVSDLAVRPNGAHLLTMVLAPYAAGPVSEWDRRPVGVAVGRELGTEAATR